jgi:hypothetical protein
MRPRVTLPLARLIAHAHGLVDGNRERDAHEAARARVDLAVDAHHLAAHVDQRPARVAGVDGHVGLDEGQVVAGVALLGADDAGGDGVLQPKGEPMAITHSPTRRRPTSPILTNGRPVASILTSATSVRLSAHDAGLELALVGQVTMTSSAPSTTCALVIT